MGELADAKEQLAEEAAAKDRLNDSVGKLTAEVDTLQTELAVAKADAAKVRRGAKEGKRCMGEVGARVALWGKNGALGEEWRSGGRMALWGKNGALGEEWRVPAGAGFCVGQGREGRRLDRATRPPGRFAEGGWHAREGAGHAS